MMFSVAKIIRRETRPQHLGPCAFCAFLRPYSFRRTLRATPSPMNITRLLAFGLLVVTSFAHAAEKQPTKITVQLDWVAEPEHGGFYQAEARGYFRAEGLDVTLIPGGPGAH